MIRPLRNEPIRLGTPPCSCPGAPWDSVEPPPPVCARHRRARIRVTAAELEAKWFSPDSTGMGHDHQTEEVFVQMSDGTEYACTFEEKRAAALTEGTEGG